MKKILRVLLVFLMMASFITVPAKVSAFMQGFVGGFEITCPDEIFEILIIFETPSAAHFRLLYQHGLPLPPEIANGSMTFEEYALAAHDRFRQQISQIMSSDEYEIFATMHRVSNGMYMRVRAGMIAAVAELPEVDVVFPERRENPPPPPFGYVVSGTLPDHHDLGTVTIPYIFPGFPYFFHLWIQTIIPWGMGFSGRIEASLAGYNPDSFTLELAGIGFPGENWFVIEPKLNLPPGVHRATFVLKCFCIHENLAWEVEVTEVSFTVLCGECGESDCICPAAPTATVRLGTHPLSGRYEVILDVTRGGNATGTGDYWVVVTSCRGVGVPAVSVFEIEIPGDSLAGFATGMFVRPEPYATTSAIVTNTRPMSFG